MSSAAVLSRIVRRTHFYPADCRRAGLYTEFTHPGMVLPGDWRISLVWRSRDAYSSGGPRGIVLIVLALGPFLF